MPPKVEKKKDTQRSESRSNLVGRFTTSVKKFVQEVESDGTREGAVQTNERLRNTTHKVAESYTMVRSSLLNLHKRYEESKSERNVFHKYNLYRSIIKDVIVLEVQYWILLDIPKQEKQEQVATYVLRACSALEKASETRTGGDSTSSKGGGGGGQTALKGLDEEQREKERARVDAMAVKEIEEENNQLVNELYRFLKKYMTLRNIIYELKVSYMDAKVYPIVPRYTMLKEMIKDVVRHPNYMEVCHEDANLNIPDT